MPSTFTVVKCWRWPRLRWVFLRRFFLKAMTFSPWPCSTISHWTEAPLTSGAPILGRVAAQHQDLEVELGADIARQGFRPSGRCPWPLYTVFRRCGRPRTWSKSFENNWFSGERESPESGGIYAKTLAGQGRVFQARCLLIRRCWRSCDLRQHRPQPAAPPRHQTAIHLGVGDGKGDARQLRRWRPTASWRAAAHSPPHPAARRRSAPPPAG